MSLSHCANHFTFITKQSQLLTIKKNIMNIEFHTPFNKVSEKLVSEIRNELLELSHINKNISRAEVMLKADGHIIAPENKICEIRLTIYGNDMISHTRTENFEKSAKEAIRELKRIVRQQAKLHDAPPDIVISTVKV
jgi:ribosome-associated translation inhibitor RaiA